MWYHSWGQVKWRYTVTKTDTPQQGLGALAGEAVRKALVRTGLSLRKEKGSPRPPPPPRPKAIAGEEEGGRFFSPAQEIDRPR